jgi:hypothetical protein
MADPVKTFNDKTNISLHQQIALGFAMPPLYPFGTIVQVPKIDKDGTVADESLQKSINNGLANLASTYWQVPVTLKLNSETEGFTLPVDPLLSLSGGNKLVRRYVSKSDKRGSIKERWNQDDYEINIAGIITGDDQYTINDYLQRLRTYCEARESVAAICDLLNNVFEIYNIAIDSYDFPFTPGENNQQFTIKAYSDDNYA